MTTDSRIIRAFASMGCAVISQDDCERLGLWLRVCGCGAIVEARIEAKGGISTTFCPECSDALDADKDDQKRLAAAGG